MGAGGQDTEGSCTTGAAGGEQRKWRSSQVALTHVCSGKGTELVAFAEDARGKEKPYKKHTTVTLYVS